MRSTFFMFALIVAIFEHRASPVWAARPNGEQAQPIAKGIWLIPGGILQNREPDGNTVIFQSPKGMIVMDTGRHTWHREAIEDFARSRHEKIIAIINSHWHLDHVSGNPGLRRAFPNLSVYASNAIDGALKGFLARSIIDSRSYLKSGTLPPDSADDVRADIATIKAGNLLRPDIVISKSERRNLGGRTLELNLAPNAATAGDVWVYDRATAVVAVGDLITLPAPFMDTACPIGWKMALAKISSQPWKVLIPGHGFPMTRKQFSAYKEGFNSLISCSSSRRDKLECATKWASDVFSLIGSNKHELKQAKEMAAYYVADVLRAHGGKSGECKAR